MNTQNEVRAHARFSASGSERWLGCPGSVRLCEIAPLSSRSNPYAEEGTRAHKCLEDILAAMITPTRGRFKSTLKRLTAEYGEEMVGHAHSAAIWIQERYLMAIPRSTLLSEAKVELPVSEPGQFGTVDAAIVELFGTLTVVDFKYGAGVVVEAEENPQLIYYALSLAAKYDYNFERVRLVILQPRAADQNTGAVREWVTDIQTLLDWREKFEAGIAVAKAPDAPLVVGDWCRWCPAKIICPEQSTKALKQAKIDFEPSKYFAPVIPATVLGLSPQDVSQILTAAKRIEDWLSKVREHAFDLLERGTKVPGWKLVEKRGTRKWLDVGKATSKAYKLFGDKAFSDPELLSPAQLEKLGPAARSFVDENTTCVSSGFTLAPESDNRPPKGGLIDEFDEVETANGKGGETDMAKKKKAKKAKKTKTN